MAKYRVIQIPIGSATPPGTGDSEVSASVSRDVLTNLTWYVGHFPKASTPLDTTLRFRLPLPFEVDVSASGSMQVILRWRINTAVGAVRWNVSTLSKYSGDNFDSALPSGSSSNETVSASTNILKDSSFSVSLTGLTPLSTVVLQITREASHAGDTAGSSVDAELIDILVKMPVRDVDCWQIQATPIPNQTTKYFWLPPYNCVVQKIELFTDVILASPGTYTAAFLKNGTTTLLNAATYDLETLVSRTRTLPTLTGTSANLQLTTADYVELDLVSNDVVLTGGDVLVFITYCPI